MTTTINSLNSTTSELQVNSNPALRFDDTAKTVRAVAPYNLVGNGPAFSAYLSANQTVTANTVTKIALNTEKFDTNSNFDNMTNYRFTPTVAGYYLFTGQLYGNQPLVYLYKNGVQATFAQSISNPVSMPTTKLEYMNGTTDYVELFGRVASTTFGGGSGLTYFEGFLVRAA